MKRRTYRTTKFYESEVKQRLKNLSTRLEYERIKEKFNIGSTSTKSMEQQGLSKIEIRKYWKREYQILTGEYEEKRDRQFIKNYIEQLERNDVDEELITQFKNLARLKKNRKYLISRVPDFAFWGYSKNQQYRQLSEEELDENINDLEEVINKLKENPIRTIK